LSGCSGGLQLFEGADLVDPLGVGDVPFEPSESGDPMSDHSGIQRRG